MTKNKKLARNFTKQWTNSAPRCALLLYVVDPFIRLIHRESIQSQFPNIIFSSRVLSQLSFDMIVNTTAQE